MGCSELLASVRKEGTVIKVKIGYEDICFVGSLGCKTCSEINKNLLVQKRQRGEQSKG